MSRPYGRHIDDLPMQQFYPIILAQDACLHHAMEILGGKPMRGQLHSHPLPPALIFVETPRLLTSTGPPSHPFFPRLHESLERDPYCAEECRVPVASRVDGMPFPHSAPIKVQVMPSGRTLIIPDSPQLEHKARQHRITGDGLRVIEALHRCLWTVSIDFFFYRVDQPAKSRTVVEILLHFGLHGGERIRW